MCFLIEKSLSSTNFLSPCQLVNKDLYQGIVARLRDVVRRKSPELWENRTSMMHHDNAPAHVSLLIAVICKTSDILWGLSTLFSELNTSRLFPVSQTSNHFERTSFPNHRGDSGKRNKITARHHRTCVPGSIPTVEETWGRCIASRGDYFEGDSD